MRRFFLAAVAAVAAAACASPAAAIDHNNLDAHRPLRFDDAEAIAYREIAFEGGIVFGYANGRSLFGTVDTELLYGFARNTHALVGFTSTWGGRRDFPGDPTHRARLERGEVSLGLLHNFNRETENSPAFGARVDVLFPRRQHTRATSIRVRGIASRRATQYDRLHLNVDVVLTPGAPANEREVVPGLVLGYSRPLGYPTRFNRTLVAEVAVQAGHFEDTGPVVTLGVGVRQQIGVRSVVDFGLESDAVGFDRSPRDAVRLIGNYSFGF
jgi:hypothetical protein